MESSRVPLIIHDPRHPNSGKGVRCRALAGNVDFAPTILALAGLPAPKGIDGRSLLPLYDDPDAAIREWLPLINVWGPAAVHSLSVVTKDWKYIFWPHAEGDFRPTEELYCIQQDRLELTNLAADAAQGSVLEQMRSVYDAAIAAWREQAVPYHRYAEFGVIFDRRVRWSEKRGLVRERSEAGRNRRRTNRRNRQEL